MVKVPLFANNIALAGQLKRPARVGGAVTSFREALAGLRMGFTPLRLALTSLREALTRRRTRFTSVRMEVTAVCLGFRATRAI